MDHTTNSTARDAEPVSDERLENLDALGSRAADCGYTVSRRLSDLKQAAPRSFGDRLTNTAARSRGVPGVIVDVTRGVS